MPYEYKCQHCGKEFTNKNKGKKYCSQKCVKDDSKRGVIGICANCSRQCYVAAYKIGKVNKVFCCFECNMAYQVKRRPDRVCKHCGVVFRKKCRANAGYCSWDCFKQSDENIARLALMRKEQASRKTTRLEKAGYDLLEVLGLTYQPQYVYGGRYVADAYVEDQNLILQFDGDYWHGHPDKFPYLSERQSRQKEVDERANDAARNLGYRVLRIWESDIRDIEGIKQRILGG